MPASDEPRLIALQLPPGPAFVDALEEVWAAGDAAFPLDPGLPRPELQRLLDETRPAALRSEQGEVELPGALPVEPGVALVVATSGTTGPRKAVELTHRALRAAAEASLARLGAVSGERWLCCLPPWHVAGLSILVRSALLDAPAIVHPRFHIEAIAREREASFVSLVPTMLVRLLDAGLDLTRWRAILLGGAAIPPDLLDRARAAGARVVTSYGMTETSGGVVYDGRPLDRVELKIEAGGRIAVRGPMLMRAYRNRPELTARALRGGWLFTSDVGRIDEDGRLRVLGRSDAVIVTGGEKVVPEEVERILLEHPLVAQARVVGEPDPEWGERVVALVVPQNDEARPVLAELRAFVKERAPAHAAPRRLVVLRTPAGPGDGTPGARQGRIV